MRYPSSLALALLISLHQVPAQCDSLSGKIRDYSKRAPNDGMAGITVTVTSASGPPRDVTTDANGNYSAGRLAGGAYTLVVDIAGYLAEPTKLPVMVAGKSGADVYMVPDNGSQAQYSGVASNMLTVAASAPSESTRGASLQELWKHLGGIGLRPDSRFLVAQEMQKQDARSATWCPPIKDYLAVSKEQIASAGEVFYTLAQTGRAPDASSISSSFGSIRPGANLVADLAYYQAVFVKRPVPVSSAFIKDFGAKWGQTSYTSQLFREQVKKPNTTIFLDPDYSLHRSRVP